MRHSSFGLTSFAAGITLALAISASAQLPINYTRFSDVLDTDESAPAIENLSSLGVIQGYQNGRFGPNDPLTRSQIALILDRYDKAKVEPLREQIAMLRDELNLSECGDGFRDLDEECDDGDTTSGDGCSNKCQIEESSSFCPDGRRIGESFPSDDGCNTCTCTEFGVACTKMACVDPPGKKCFSSSDCSARQYCTTETGDCQSACPPGNDACIQVCAGVCKPRSELDECAPHVCADGTTHAACTSDGSPINYFADPCLTHGGAASSRSSSGDTTASCNDEQAAYDLAVVQNRSCEVDSDCALVIKSCPLVTCGVAVSKTGQRVVQSRADDLITCKERSGQPLPCAMCVQMELSCVQGLCTAKSSI